MAALANRTGVRPPRASWWDHALRLLGLGTRVHAVSESHGAGRVAARAKRLPALGDRLEAILAELDELEAWREAADVCSAVERIRSHTNAGGPAE
jgi:hypothetical protein